MPVGVSFSVSLVGRVCVECSESFLRWSVCIVRADCLGSACLCSCIYIYINIYSRNSHGILKEGIKGFSRNTEGILKGNCRDAEGILKQYSRDTEGILKGY